MVASRVPAESTSAALLLAAAALAPLARACTTVGVSAGASVDRKVIASQSNDGGGDSDTRLFRVPAMDYPKGSRRPVYKYVGNYPRYVGPSRGADNYKPEKGQNISKPIGYIPQVEHTYAYYDGTFGLLNEHGVGIAESTCTARTGALARPHGAALWYTDELSRVAMERATSARGAVEMMGALAVEGGFYGEDNFEGTAESLIVADAAEAWVFHVLSSDDKGTSAVWAARRVPEGHVTVVPNIFVIRELNLTDTDNYLASSNVYAIAEANGWWNKTEGPFDFTKAYSNGEYGHRYYSGRRWWGAVRILAPSLRFPMNYTNLRDDAPYPFSVPVERKVCAQDVITVMRSFYEGTPVDLTRGLAAGPFANPNRYRAGAGGAGIPGAWERSISIYRTDYSLIIEIDPDLPPAVGAVMWFGPVAAHATAFVPLFAGQDHLWQAYGRGSKGGGVDRASAMWAFRYLQQVVNLNFARMMGDVRALQAGVEARGRALVKEMADTWKGNATLLATAANAHAEKTVEAWWKMADHLIFRYADGNIYSDDGKVATAGYPEWWLKAVGYENGPPPPPLADEL